MQNAKAFRDLYAELRLYYRGANLHLEETLAEFWARLLERLFRQLHPQLLLPDDYLDCLGKQAEPLRPFGEAPRELRLRATRAFVAARAFVQGLGVASDVVRKVAQVRAEAPPPAARPRAPPRGPGTPGVPFHPPPGRVGGSSMRALLGAAMARPVPGRKGREEGCGWLLSQLQGSGGRETGDEGGVCSEAGARDAWPRRAARSCQTHQRRVWEGIVSHLHPHWGP